MRPWLLRSAVSGDSNVHTSVAISNGVSIVCCRRVTDCQRVDS